MKKLTTALLLVLTVLMVTSCASSLAVSYNQPSNINMSNYKNIAIASAQSFNGNYYAPFFIRNMIFDSSIKRYELYPSSYNFSYLNDAVTKKVTSLVNSSFATPSSNGYYHILDNSQTDTYISLARIGRDAFKELKDAGYDAVLIPKVTILDCDEYISAYWGKDKDGKKVAKYELNRSLRIGFSLTVIDTTTGQIVAQRNYEDSTHDTISFDPERTSYFSDRMTYYMVDDCFYGMGSRIINDFVPTQRTTHIDLMDNKPKLAVLENAFSAAKSGNLDLALSIFRNTYETQGHIAAGYNAAVILAAQNDIDDALLILNDIQRKTFNKKVNNLYSRLSVLKEKNEKAEAQMNSTTTAPAVQGDQKTVLDYLLN